MAYHILVLVTCVSMGKLQDANTPEKQEALRREIFDNAFGFLSPYQGKEFSSFEPADTAWHQPLYHSYGVVLGATDPALFMYFFSMVNTTQRGQVEQRLLGHVSSEAEAVFRAEENGIGITAYAIKHDKLNSCEWLKRFSDGVFQADSVLYSIDRYKGNLNEAEQTEIMKGMKNYALCILKINVR